MVIRTIKLIKTFLLFIFLLIILNNCSSKKDLLTAPAIKVTATTILSTTTPGINPTQTPTPYYNYYGGSGYDFPYSAVCTGDGYLIVGKSNSFSNGNDDVYLVKTDLYGNFLWHKIYGGIYDDEGHSIKQTSDGNYIICGNTDPIGRSYYTRDIYYLKIDPNGNVIWEKTYGSLSISEEGSCALQDTDGGYIIAGRTDYSESVLLKTDANGDCVWVKTYQYIYFMRGEPIIVDNNDYIVLTSRPGLIKIDSSGNIIWEKNYTDYSYIYFFDGKLVKSSDNNYVLLICSYNQNLLLKADSDGDCVWARTYNNLIGSYSCFIATPNNFILAGTNSDKIAVLKLDSSGNEIWMKTYGGFFDEQPTYCLLSPYDNYVIVGVNWYYGALGDYFLMEIDTEGNKLW